MTLRRSSSIGHSKKKRRTYYLDNLPIGPRLESMESRLMLSATLTDGLLVIDGTVDADLIAVVAGVSLGEVVVNGPDIAANTLFTGVTGITINGLEGNDTITVGSNINSAANRKIAVTINGGDDDDTIAGGSGNDLIDGGAGTDTIDYSAATARVDVRLDQNKASKDGLGGRDTLNNFENVIGSAFNDSIRGDDNVNVLTGGEGNDTLQGGGGGDTLNGNGGNDKIEDKEGGNTIDAGDGDNKVSTGTGDDTITTGNGNDKIEDKGGTNIIDAGDGDNKISTGNGDDTVTTGSGNDTITTKGGDDVINTGSGNDRISAGDGDDDIECGDGDDRVDGGKDDDSINGGAGDDDLRGNDGFDTIDGGDDDDDIDGGRDDDSISGGLGDDIIKCGDGDDRAQGDDGDDFIDGGRDDDSIDGGSDDDDVRGGDGDDDVRGGVGDDRIRAGRGRDRISSGSGNDDVADDDRDDDYYEDDDISDDDDGNGDGDDDNPTGGPNAGAVELTFDENGQASATGTSLNNNDRDIFKFTAAADGVLTVVSATTNGNFAKVEVEAAGEFEQEGETEPNDGINTFQLALVQGRTYFVKIKSPNKTPAGYSVTFSAGEGTIEQGGGSENAPAAPADVFDELEPNDTKITALAFVFPQANVVRLIGTSLNDSDKDYFKFTASVSGTLAAHVYTDQGQLANVEIESQTGIDILEIEQGDGQNTAQGPIVAGVTYFIRVRSETGGPANYLLDLTIS